MLRRLVCLMFCLIAVGCSSSDASAKPSGPIVITRPTLTATPLPSPTDTATPTPSPTPTVTPSATPTATPSPPPTDTPVPSATSTPSPTPSPTARSAERTILWDLSHGPRTSSTGLRYSPSELFSDLTDLLGRNQVTVVENVRPLDEQDLTRYDAVVIAATSTFTAAFSAAEADLLADYVAAGGGLLILAEDSNFRNYIAAVTERFGIEAAGSSGIAAVRALADHPIFNGVSTVRFYDGGHLAVNERSATILATANGVPVIVTVAHGSGRVVIVGDSNLFDNRWLDDNVPFAVNLFRWIAFQE